MITRSDNATANLLADRLGWANVNNTMQELGMRETRQVGDRITTSPRDLLHLLELLALGRGPSTAASTEMVELLLAQKVNDRLPAQLPRDTPVAHKTGNLDGVVHDVGIVYSPDATYAIALLSEETPDVGQVTQAEAALSRAVYDYFNAPGGARARSALRAPNPAARPTPVPPVVVTAPGATPGTAAGATLPASGTTTAPTPLPAAVTSAPVTSAPGVRPSPPPAPTVAVVASPGRSDPPTVAPPPTAVRPTLAPDTQPAAPALAPTTAPVVTAVRPTAPPAVPAAPPTEPARGPLPPNAAPAAPQPTAVRPTAAPAAPPTAAPAAAPTARAPEAPRFGGATTVPAR
jgi:hypothetical protein